MALRQISLGLLAKESVKDASRRKDWGTKVKPPKIQPFTVVRNNKETWYKCTGSFSHPFARSLVCSHPWLIHSICPACFAHALCSAHWFTRSLEWELMKRCCDIRLFWAKVRRFNDWGSSSQWGQRQPYNLSLGKKKRRKERIKKGEKKRKDVNLWDGRGNLSKTAFAAQTVKRKRRILYKNMVDPPQKHTSLLFKDLCSIKEKPLCIEIIVCGFCSYLVFCVSKMVQIRFLFFFYLSKRLNVVMKCIHTRILK